jgi:hypothetical protein
MSFVRIALAALACTAAAAGAQEIVLYQSDNFNGPRYSASTSVSDLARSAADRGSFAPTPTFAASASR